MKQNLDKFNNFVFKAFVPDKFSTNFRYKLKSKINTIQPAKKQAKKKITDGLFMEQKTLAKILR